MIGRQLTVFDVLAACEPDGSDNWTPSAALANGPVADDPAHVAAEIGDVIGDLDRDDVDAVRHG